MSEKNNKGLVKGLALGVALGAVMGGVAGILGAPKSGKENREDLKKGMKDMKEQSEAKLAIASMGIKTQLGKLFGKAEAAKTATKQETAKQLEQAAAELKEEE